MKTLNENLKVTDNNMVAVWMVEPEITLTDRMINNRAKKYLELKELRKEAEARVAELKAEMDAIADELIAGIGAVTESKAVDTKKYIITNTVYEDSRLNTAKLKAEQPDLYAEYCERKPRNRFSVKVSKG